MYKTIVADPPWQPTMALVNSPASGIGASKASPQRHYATLGVADICRLRPKTEDKAHLYLWVLSQHIDWGYTVARAWGFEPLQTLTWAKPGMGAGRFQCNTEHVLVCRKGARHGNPFGMTGGTWFNWKRGRHSAKPEEFYSLVERCSPGPYLEMFARERRMGWDAWGNEVDCNDLCLSPV
jgi:N6-adenosine-specific RNA methylase IME4